MRKYIIAVDGFSIEVIESEGKGDPLFLFHGNSSAANSYLQVIRGPVGKQRKLIAVSFPGHGGSSHWKSEEEDCSFEYLGKLAAKTVNVFGYKSYWLLGQSLGGHAILESLEHFPGVRGVLLISAPPISSGTLGEAFKPDPSGGLLFKGALNENEVDIFASCFLQRSDEYSRTLVKDCIRTTDYKFRPALGKSLMGGAIKDELEAIMGCSYPIALLAGTEDKFLRREFYENLPLDRFWKRRVIWFENCGHALNFEDPESFEQIIGEFIGTSHPESDELNGGQNSMMFSN